MPKRLAASPAVGGTGEVEPQPPVAVVHRDRLVEATARVRDEASIELSLAERVPWERGPRHQRASPACVRGRVAEPPLLACRLAIAERGVAEQGDRRESGSDYGDRGDRKPRRRRQRLCGPPSSYGEQDRDAAEKRRQRNRGQLPVPVDTRVHEVCGIGP